MLDNKKQLQKSYGHVTHYDILTKPTLFRNYLRSSESVEVRFSSGISNIDIGKANIPIPVELIEFFDQQSFNSTQKTKKFRKRCHIFNAQNKIMGELLAEYELVLYDRVFSETEMDSEILTNKCTTKKNVGIENDMNQFNLDLDHGPISSTKKSHKKKSKSPHKKIHIEKLIDKVPTSNTKRLSSKATCASPLLNYLTGRPLAEIEENEAVKAMQSTSPTESLINFLSYDLNGLYLPKKTNDAELKVLKKIDCLRVQVYDLCLTRAGTREILSKNATNESGFSSGTFSIDVDLDSILSIKSPFEKNNVFTSKVTRIFGSSIETLPPSVTINRSSVHKLNAFCIKSRSSYANGIISLIVRYRDIESSESRTLGTAQIQLADVIQAANLTFRQQCPVTTTISEIIIGRLSVKVELGCRGLHFGADFLEAISSNAIDGPVHSVVASECYSHLQYSNREYPLSARLSEGRECLDSHKSYEWRDYKHRVGDLFYENCAYDIHDDQTGDRSDNPSTPLNLDLQSNNSQRKNGRNVENIGDDTSGRDVTHALGNVDDMSDDAGDALNGLFHIGQINYCSWYQSTADTFLVCRPFWSDSALVTENCPNKTNEENYQLNYLELFSVICDEKLFESTKHGFMSIEVWQRGSNQPDALIGSAKVPLHQFFIAFNNTSIRNHVSQQELPVISIDGWVTISYAVSPSNTPVGTVQAILAVGTTKQINNLNKSKSLLSCKNFLQFPLDRYPQQQATPSIDESNRESVKSSMSQSNDRNSNFAAIFSNFIDTLASRLPERNVTASETAPTNDATTQTNNSANNSLAKNDSGKYMRPTSELLDELQRALAMAPTPAQKSAIQHMVMPNQAPQIEQSVPSEPKKATMFRVHIEIESALHLPSMAVHVNKKSGKRNRNAINTAKKTSSSTEIQPSAYATFEAAASAATPNLMAYATNIVENSCSPQWNKQFEVYLPVEFLQNDEKRFVIRVWRKISDNTPKTRLIPNSSNDVTIGFATVDLSVLLAGLPTISGWFNIIDHSGCINGQIKIHIKPKDDITVHQKRQPQPEMNILSAVNQPSCEPLKREHSEKMDEAPLEVTSKESRAVDDSALSRALKRKFTELEEITQRLRARLFDVTGNMSIDPDDEFENDLNTIPDEEDDFEESNIASSMSLDWLEHCHNQASSNDSNNLEPSIADDMQDIFEFLSPDFGANQSTPPNQSNPMNMDFLHNKINERFNDVLNDRTAVNERKEDTMQNIAESLQKSAIND
ncbi:C2 domain-containing protein 3 isoform X2 [Sitodiplosis mosellana]|uniref:C2 domain-containing protein 3 isoform X2 n=1 Tax=Sitodiplosis mosellana TaxID=263140 RepID=UPI002444EF31|nr:C2 domain-containing protein 3 isoform X2 [Sitodiplosis mosellana]